MASEHNQGTANSTDGCNTVANTTALAAKLHNENDRGINISQLSVRVL
jgi:hypothetical protein